MNGIELLAAVFLIYLAGVATVYITAAVTQRLSHGKSIVPNIKRQAEAEDEPAYRNPFSGHKH